MTRIRVPGLRMPRIGMPGIRVAHIIDSLRMGGAQQLLVTFAGLAPAWQEQTVYGYVTPATLAWLGESALYCCTEVHTKDDIDRLVSSLREVLA